MRSHLRPACFALSSLLLMGQAHSQELGLKLKLQRELIPYSIGDQEETPLFIEADRVQGHQSRELEAEGAVRLRRRGEAVFADYLRYSFPDESVSARGKVRFERQGNAVEGESLAYNLRDGTGIFEKPTYYLIDVDAHGTAERMVAESRTRFRVERATYTNCEVGDDDWFLRVDRLELDRTRDLGVARNATVVFKGVPLLYSPYLDFSLSGSRKSGLLAPSIGQTAQSGFEYTQPYYWNIAPNRDATIAPRFLSRRGVLLNTEFRYLEPSFSGEWRSEWLPNDRVRDDNRYGYSVQHRQNVLGALGSMGATKLNAPVQSLVPDGDATHHYAARIGVITILVLVLWKALTPRRVRMVPAPLVAVLTCWSGPAAGDDRWIAIAVEDDTQWCALRRHMGDPAWAAILDADPLLAPALGDIDLWAVARRILGLAPLGGAIGRRGGMARDLDAHATAALEREVRRIADALAHRVERLRLLGNGVDPVAACDAWLHLDARHRAAGREVRTGHGLRLARRVEIAQVEGGRLAGVVVRHRVLRRGGGGGEVGVRGGEDPHVDVVRGVRRRARHRRVGGHAVLRRPHRRGSRQRRRRRP